MHRSGGVQCRVVLEHNAHGFTVLRERLLTQHLRLAAIPVGVRFVLEIWMNPADKSESAPECTKTTDPWNIIQLSPQRPQHAFRLTILWQHMSYLLFTLGQSRT